MFGDLAEPYSGVSPDSPTLRNCAKEFLTAAWNLKEPRSFLRGCCNEGTAMIREVRVPNTLQELQEMIQKREFAIDLLTEWRCSRSACR